MSFIEFIKLNQDNETNKENFDNIKEIDIKLNKNNEVDVAIVFVNASSYKNYLIIDDGLDPDLWSETKELINIIKQYIKVIVVINVLTFEEPYWLQEVNALLFSGYPGAEASQVIADILFGEVNPSGHLPYKIKFTQNFKDLSFLDNLSVIDTKIKKDEFKFNELDNAISFKKKKSYDMKHYNYSEVLIFFERLFSKKKTIFPFGYGLPMMFLIFPKNIGNSPEHIFKGFEKVEIKPDETIKVKIFADDHALSYFNVTDNKYIRVCEGKIKVYIAENGDISEAKLMAQINAKC